MIRKLQTRFILVAVSSVLLVLTAIMGAINITNYHNVVKSADQILDALKENGGTFEDVPGKPDLTASNTGTAPTSGTGTTAASAAGTTAASATGTTAASAAGAAADNGPDKAGPWGGRGLKPDRLSPETPYESRYFSVTFSSDGEIAATDTNRIVSVSESQAAEYARKVYESGRTSGFSGSFRFLAYTAEDSPAASQNTDSQAQDASASETVILFLDCTRSLGSFRSFLWTSIAMSVAGMAAVFALVLFFSGRVIRPIRESYEKQKRFITDAGHELRTPLTIIDADISVLEMDLGPNDWLSDVKVQTKRLSGLTNDLVYLSRMDEGTGRLEKIDFPISDLVTETVSSYRSRAQIEGKALTADIQPMLSYCGDEKAITKLVNILMDNAMKYSSDKGDIKITLARAGKGVEIAVTNSVDSLDPDMLKHMFDRFYRGDASRNSEKGGYGLGLSIVAAVAAAHGGRAAASAVDPHTIRIAAVLG